MPYLAKADFKTHGYLETIDEIARVDEDAGNEALLIDAIEVAIAEAKSYLRRYDLKALFGYMNGASYVAPTVTDANLKSKVKDLAFWHFIQVGNANIEMARVQAKYEYAVSWFKSIGKGADGTPEGWTYHDTTTDTALPEGNTVHYVSEEKRGNDY